VVLKNKEIVRMEGIYKQFPGVLALENVDFQINEGQIHGIVGENGAGKSTLIKILTGALQPTRGDIFVDGKKVIISDPIVARNLQIGAVYQDLTVARDLTVAENFFLGQIPKNRFGFVSWRKMIKKTAEVLKELNIEVNPNMILERLTAAQKEMVLIAKQYFEKYRVVIFDEPTALLTSKDTEELFRIIKKLKKESVGIIYISHRIEEVFEICDTVTVLRDGKKIVCVPVNETDIDGLISRMVGRNIDDMYSINHQKLINEVLRVENLSKTGEFENINFSVNRGEIFGLFGLVNSGTTKIARAIYGAENFDRGNIYIDSEAVRINSPTMGVNNGLGFLPEDKKTEGLAIKLSVKHNINLSSYPMISRMGFVKGKLENKNALEQIKSLNIKTPSIEQIVLNLSGGNQQKVVLAKWLVNKCKIFIFEEPTAGIDVGAKEEIYKILELLIKKGSAIIMISSYLPELIGIADCITVVYEGKQMGTLSRDRFNEKRLLQLASGVNLKEDNVR
jgi:ribose transport system ATP-binding protein